MSDHDKSPAEIEREIEAERSALARSLDELQSQFSPERMVNVATEYMRENGGDVARTVQRQVKDNPIAVALTGVGLAWLIAGGSKSSSGDRREARYGAAPRFRHDEGHDYGTADATGGYAPAPRPAWDDRSYRSAPGTLSDPMRGDVDGRIASAEGDDPSAWDKAKDKAGDWSDEAKDGVAATGASIRDSARTSGSAMNDRWDGAQDAASDRWNETSLRWREWQSDLRGRTASARGRAYARSAELKARLSEGTESMTEQARARVMGARQAAYEAQRDIEARYVQYRNRTGRFYDEQPLVFGALALGVGALLGAALPRTHKENELIGSYRDQAFDEAERVFHQEAARARAVAEAAVGEAQDIAKEKMDEVRGKVDGAKEATPTGEEAVGKAETEVRGAAGRIAEAAKAEAKKQDLGGSIN
jgi:hypothetical protein